MRFGMSVKSFRIIAVFVCLSLVLEMTGCKRPGTATQPGTVQEGSSPTEDQSGNGTQPDTGENSVTAGPDETGKAPEAAKIDDNGKPIVDFDEFVNGEWKKEQEANGEKKYRRMGSAWAYCE